MQATSSKASIVCGFLTTSVMLASCHLPQILSVSDEEFLDSFADNCFHWDI